MVEKIKIRRKEGVGLFVFLIFSGLYFFGIPDFFGVLDYKYDNYYEELITFFSRVVLPAPFLVGIFLLSLYKTEKRIKEGRFNFWRSLFFSLAVSLMAGFLWFLQLITGFGYGYSKQDVVKQLFFSDIWIFPTGSIASMILVFIFSFVPSLFLYKFYLKQKKFYIAVASFFFLLFLGLFGYQQMGVLTCVFNHDSYCVASKALKTKDISLCEKVKISKETGDYGKNYCYVVVSKKWDDIDLCDKIRIGADKKTKNPPYGQYQAYQCISNIAKNTKNKELCEKIPISEFKDFELIREKCLNDSDNKPETNLNNWKTYRNEEYGFELRHPKNLKISQSDIKGRSVVVDGDNLILNINPVNFIKEWDVKNICYMADIGDTRILEKLEVNESKMPLCIEDSQKELLIFYRILIPKNKNQTISTIGDYFEFEAQIYGGSTIQDRLNMFKQILSTFKFID